MTAREAIPLGSLPPSEPPQRLALHCGEARISTAIATLLGDSERVTDRITLPGGAWWLAQAAELTEGRVKRFFLGGRLPVKQVVESILGPRTLREVVLVGHQDCAWYRDLTPRATPGQLVRAQGEDMHRARDEILHWAPRAVTVTGWMIVLDESGDASARRLF